MVTIAEVVVQCPSCLEPNQQSAVASFGSWYLTSWTDGWRDPLPPPCAIHRCGACRAVAFRDAFRDLGLLTRPETLCDVELIGVGRERVRVMQTLRARMDVELTLVKRLVDAVPVMVAKDLRVHEGEILAIALREAGATCELHSRKVGSRSPPAWFDAPHLSEVRDIESLRAQLQLTGLAPARERALRLELYWAGNHPFRDRSRTWISVNTRAAEERKNAELLFSLIAEDNPENRIMKANLARESDDFAAARRLLASGPWGNLEPVATYLRALTDRQDSAVLPIIRGDRDAA